MTEMEPEERPSLLWRVWEQVGTILLAIAIALGIRAFVIEPFRIPSGSMLPTLLIGDHLFVNKFIYGASVPFTDIRFPAIRDPERGDVVVFAVARDGDRILPVDQNPDLPRDDFVKRLVGLPGDRVEMRDGVVFINGERIAQDDTGAEFVAEYNRRLKIERESLGDCDHMILEDLQLRGMASDNMRPLVVPPGRYFMLGDNRNYSRDSRDWGTVRREELKGPAFILYWSWNVRGNFFEFLNPVNWWSAEKRWNRLLMPVQCGIPDPLPDHS